MSTGMSAGKNSPADLQALAQQIADEREIVALTITYTWALDSRDWATLRDVFVPDATASLGRDLVGVEAIIERISGALDPLDMSQHIISNHQIVVDGSGQTATCRCYLQAQHVRHAAADLGKSGVNSSSQAPRNDDRIPPSSLRNFIIGGRYLDDLVRTPNGWRIKHRTLAMDWTDGNPAVVFRPAS
jgi:hypothetical protein